MVYLQVWICIICMLQVCEDFLFANEIAIPQQEFLLKKLIIESLRYRKTSPRYFCFQTSLNLCISFSFQFNSRREVFLEDIVPENMFSFPGAFFPQCLRKKCAEFFTAMVLLLSAILLKVEVLNRLWAPLWKKWSWQI